MIDIQIVNFHSSHFLSDLLKELQLDIGKLARIHILDNSQPSEDLSFTKKICPKVDLQYFPTNIGFGAGHNFLAGRGKEEHILILNPDVKILEENTVSRLLEQMEKTRCDVIGPKLVDSHHKYQVWDHGECRGVIAHAAQYVGTSIWVQRSSITEVAWVSGAFFLLTRAAFNKIGGFDPQFFLYKEEEDLCLRLRKLGGCVYYDPEVKVMHFGSDSKQKERFLKISHQLFRRKHCNWLGETIGSLLP